MRERYGSGANEERDIRARVLDLFFFSDFIAPWGRVGENFSLKEKNQSGKRNLSPLGFTARGFYERETSEYRTRLEDRTIESRALLVYGGGCRSEDRFRARFLPFTRSRFLFPFVFFLFVSLSLSWFKSLTTISLLLGFYTVII